jgi:transcriptional regulator with XRE-family HTH domain
MPLNQRDRTRLGKQIVKFRRQQGWSQTRMAAELGIAQPHLSNIETGKASAGLPTLLALSQVLGWSHDEFQTWAARTTKRTTAA